MILNFHRRVCGSQSNFKQRYAEAKKVVSTKQGSGIETNLRETLGNAALFSVTAY